MSFSCDPDYKDTEVRWIGTSPEHWKIKRFKQVFKERDERSVDGSETLLSVSAYTGVSPRSEIIDDGDHLSRAESLEGYKICYPDDLVMNIMLAWNRGLGISTYKGIVSPAYCVFKVIDDSVPRFLDYLVRTNEYTGYFKAFSSGVMDSRLRIYPDVFGALSVALPPPKEQVEIVNFLDNETSKIDKLISEQEGLIELLKNRIDSLVLNSFGAHDTKTLRLANVVDVIQRPVVQKNGETYEPLGLFNRGRGLFHKPPRGIEEMGDSDFFWVKGGDLIFSGQFAWEGAVAMAYEEEESCVVSHRYPVVRGKTGLVSTEYLFALFTTAHGNFLLNECSVGAAGRNRPLNINSLLKEKIHIPNVHTQELISKMVDKRRNLLVEVSRQRDLLNERRSSLISAAVSGKLKLSNVADEAEAV
jgi:type I restriction enzyme S subunit